MRKLFKLAALLIFMGPLAAYAAPVSVSQTQDITTDGQDFTFDFLGLPASDGSGGQFSFYARGDYTDPQFETPFITFEFVSGTLQLNDMGVVSNTVAGLSLFANNTVAGGGGVDQVLDFVFDMDGSLLDSLLADNMITVFVDNPDSVNAQSSYRDFVQLTFDYNSAPKQVPTPAPLALMGLGLVGIGFVRRRKIA